MGYLHPDGQFDRSEFRAGYASCDRCKGYYDAGENWKFKTAALSACVYIPEGQPHGETRSRNPARCSTGLDSGEC